MGDGLRLLSALETIRETFSAWSLKDRIIGQKKVYFVQEMGIPLGYRFRWYLYGPYSFDLGSEAFELAAMTPLNENFDVHLPEIYSSSLGKLESFFGEVKQLPAKENELETERFWFELASSIHFLVHKAYPPETSMQGVVEKIEQEKPEYGPEDVQIAVGLLQRHGLLRSDFA